MPIWNSGVLRKLNGRRLCPFGVVLIFKLVPFTPLLANVSRYPRLKTGEVFHHEAAKESLPLYCFFIDFSDPSFTDPGAVWEIQWSDSPFGDPIHFHQPNKPLGIIASVLSEGEDVGWSEEFRNITYKGIIASLKEQYLSQTKFDAGSSIYKKTTSFRRRIGLPEEKSSRSRVASLNTKTDFQRTGKDYRARPNTSPVNRKRLLSRSGSMYWKNNAKQIQQARVHDLAKKRRTCSGFSAGSLESNENWRVRPAEARSYAALLWLSWH